MIDAPHIELDALYWMENWTPRPKEEFTARVRDAIAEESWILDGNYGSLRDVIWPRATAVV